MKFAYILLSTTFLFLMFACSDPCDDLNCGTGTCVDGTCECPDGFSGINCEIEDLCFNSMCINGSCNENTGDCDCDDNYEGDNCDVEERAKFFGTWKSIDFTCDGEQPDETEITLNKEGEINELNLIFDSDDEIEILILVDGSSLSIPIQVLTDGFDEFTLTGSGSLSENNILSLTINVEAEGEPSYSCTGTFTK